MQNYYLMNLKIHMNKTTLVKRNLMSIGQAAGYLGVSIDTLRRWERVGKIQSERADGKNRYFAKQELSKLKSSNLLTISQAASQLGLSIDTLRRLEQRGILIPKRNGHGERLYAQSVINCFKKSEYIKESKKALINDKLFLTGDSNNNSGSIFKYNFKLLIFLALLILTFILSYFIPYFKPAKDKMTPDKSIEAKINQSNFAPSLL